MGRMLWCNPYSTVTHVIGNESQTLQWLRALSALCDFIIDK